MGNFSPSGQIVVISRRGTYFSWRWCWKKHVRMLEDAWFIGLYSGSILQETFILTVQSMLSRRVSLQPIHWWKRCESVQTALPWERGFGFNQRKASLTRSWLVVWLPFFIFPYIGNVIIPVDLYFSEGWPWPTNQRSCFSHSNRPWSTLAALIGASPGPKIPTASYVTSLGSLRMWMTMEVSIVMRLPLYRWLISMGKSYSNRWWLGVPPFMETSMFDHLIWTRSLATFRRHIAATAVEMKPNDPQALVIVWKKPRFCFMFTVWPEELWYNEIFFI